MKKNLGMREKITIFAKNFKIEMKITPGLLASLVGGSVEGDAEVSITEFAKIEEAAPGCVTFIANPKYAHFINTTKASAVIVGRDFEAPKGVKATLIRVDDPYSALAELLAAFEANKSRPVGIERPCYISEDVEIPEDCYVGAFAYIGKGVRIGKGVSIYPHAYIGDNVEVGDGSTVRSLVSVYEGCRIGRRCLIHSGAVIGADGFGFAPKDGSYEKIPQVGIVVLEDDVEVGANTTIDRATFGSTVIGRGTKLDNLIQVAHNVQIGHDNVIAAQTGVAGSTHIGDSNRIGGQVGFAGHIHFGSNCEVGAQSGIPKGYGDGRRIIGYPAVDAREFARTQVYLKKLPGLFK